MTMLPEPMNTTPLRRPLGAFLLTLFLASCAREAAWSRVDETALDAGQVTQRATAERSRDALAKGLLQELTAALGASGPAAAIQVCSARAPVLATNVAAEHGVRIGRTSQRLRNAGNQAPAWAAPHVASDAAAGAWFVGPEKQLGALFPIPLGPQCAICHGAPEQIPGDVRAALQQAYPADRATGFAPGDLRGWFWVEVPARP
jgi:hypothetical protein